MALESEQMLKDVISEVLESMFFAMVEFEGCRPGDGSFDYATEIHLINHNGRIAICLQVSEGFARMITANFLGIEETQVNDDDLKDSLKELANMIGGKYHARSNCADRHLGIPSVWKLGSEGMDTIQVAGGQGFAVSGQPAGFAVLSYLPDCGE